MTNMQNESMNEIEKWDMSAGDPSIETKKTDRFAGFWMRFWAFLADLLIIFSMNGILLSPLKLINEGMEIYMGAWTLRGILAAIVFYLYFLIMTKKAGQTIGKMIFGLKVIRVDHQPLQWSDLIFREVITRFIYKTFFFLNLLYLIVAFNQEKKGFHDMVANTRVVHVE